MKTHEFSIIASGPDHTADDFEGRFYDNGCDDATVSFQKGNIILDFARDASTLEDAIISAIADVRKAGARVERVEPDPLVSLSDIAARAGLSRAAVSLYASGQRGEGFPPPYARVTTNAPLWRWSVVAKWMAMKNQLPEAMAADAATIQTVNARLEMETV